MPFWSGLKVASFQKNFDGQYLDANDVFCEIAGEQTVNAGITDHELIWRSSALTIEAHDQVCRDLQGEFVTMEARFTAEGWRRLLVIREYVGQGDIWGRMVDITGFDAASRMLPKVNPKTKVVQISPGVEIGRKEFHVAKSLYWGWSRKQVASELNLAEKSVDYYKDSLRRKFRARTIPDLMGRMNTSGLAYLLITANDWFFDESTDEFPPKL